MDNLMNINQVEVKSDKGKSTDAEIIDQPKTWKIIWKKVQAEFNQLANFLASIRNNQDLNILFTGAGSSAYIGDVVSDLWLNYFSQPLRTVPTTDLLTHFEENIQLDKPLLLVSFARSGNSPESKAVIDLADKKCREIWHFIITCNSKGKLVKIKDNENIYVFLLPPEAEDHGLAMTNSFTSMALAAVLIPKILSGRENLKTQVELLSIYGEKIINEYASTLYEIARTEFTRVVFLGSGPLWGTARESQLKVQELTDGQVIGKFDSFLGFRHGPKAIINDKTLLIYLFSNNKHTFRYERDLVDQIANHDIDLTTLGVAESNNIPAAVDHKIRLNNRQKLEEDFWAILCTLPAQIIGFYKSLLLGLNPDNPSTDGTISRVVEGVTIYEEGE
jgi:tagatose-6-phosphate ketose/aldose isomerase